METKKLMMVIKDDIIVGFVYNLHLCKCQTEC